MLVLSRLPNEALVINGNIRVVVVDVRGNKVRLAVEAPPEIRVDREEIHKLNERRKLAEQEREQGASQS